MKAARLVAVLLLVAACAGQTATPQPTAPQTSAPTAAPTVAPTATTEPTAESTPQPTRTLAPTPEPTPIPTIGPDLGIRLTVEPFVKVDPALIFFTTDGAGGHYAVGQAGRILVVALDGAVQEEPFLNITDR